MRRQRRRRQRIMLSSLVVVVLLVLGGGIWGVHAWQTRAKPVAQASSKRKVAPSQSSKVAVKTSSKRVTKPTPPRYTKFTRLTGAEHVSGVATPLDKTSTAGLVTVIGQTMRTVAASTHGPARWTVAVRALNGGAHAYVADWTPASHQFSASTIKLYILIRYYQLLQAKQINPSTQYTLRQQDVVQGSGVMLHAKLGTTYTLQELVNLMIRQSDNIATNVMMDEVGGFAAVNKTIAQVVGPDHETSLERKMMDTSHLENGKANRINAEEAVDTLLKMKQGKIVSPAADKAMLALMLHTKNRTKLPSQLPTGAVAYNKSGESNWRGIENDMAIIDYRGQTFAVCALIEMDGEHDAPLTASQAQTDSEVSAIATLGAKLTTWIAAN